jgi:hypothetical protein
LPFLIRAFYAHSNNIFNLKFILMNRTPKVLVNFTGFTDAAIDGKAQSIINAMTGNANFPKPLPTIADLTTAASDYANALSIAKTGTRTDIAVKNQERDALEALLRDLASYVNFTAKGDRAMLLSSGFDISKNGDATPVITKPESISLVNGENPGELTLSVGTVPGARAYTHEYTSDATLSEVNWQRITVTTSAYTFSGLQPGKQYFCRVAVVGTRGQMVYSDVISRFAI